MVIKENFTYDNLLRHLKHVSQYINDPRCSKEAKALANAVSDFGEKYNQIAMELTYSFAGKSGDTKAKIVGYVCDKGRCCKYNRETHDFVVYDMKTKATVTMHKKTETQFNNIKNRDFVSELPENQ